LGGTKTPVFYLDANGVPREIDGNFTGAWAELTQHSELTPLGHASFLCDPNQHPDAQRIRDWLAKHDQHARELEVVFWLAYFARNEWAIFPRRTRAQHSEIYERVANLAWELRDALNATDVEHNFGRGRGLQNLHIIMLLKARERARLARTLDIDANARDARDVALLAEGKLRLPKMQDLLDQLAVEAQRLNEQGPLHSQPNKRGAERGYFVRRMGELFQRRYRERPHEVIAALTTIALGEATDRELVAKLLA
jgi:hypothetical protein